MLERWAQQELSIYGRARSHADWGSVRSRGASGEVRFFRSKDDGTRSIWYCSSLLGLLIHTGSNCAPFHAAREERTPELMPSQPSSNLGARHRLPSGVETEASTRFPG